MSANPVTHPSAVDSAMLRSVADTVPADWHRLADYLRTQGMSFDPDQPIRQFAGGFANRNYLVVVDGARAVLRRRDGGNEVLSASRSRTSGNSRSAIDRVSMAPLSA